MAAVEQDRLAHLRQCEAEARSLVPAPRRPVAVPDHEQELLASHESTRLPRQFSVADEAIA